MKSVLVSVLIFLLWATGAFILRCHNLRDVLVEGRIYFVDSDCYSRMTRVRLIEAHPGLVIRHQDFENYPRGVDTHATAPMDYAILATKWIVVAVLRILDPHGTSILEPQVRDVAGALVSPFLGAAACGFLALFARGLSVGIGYRWTVPLCFAISPITIWGTILGRPDHQSLQMALLAVALAAECRLAGGQTRRWAVVSGVAWGLAIWVSLYEPAVLFGLVMISWLCMKPGALVARARHAGWIAFAAVLGSRDAGRRVARYAARSEDARLSGELGQDHRRTAPSQSPRARALRMARGGLPRGAHSPRDGVSRGSAGASRPDPSAGYFWAHLLAASLGIFHGAGLRAHAAVANRRPAAGLAEGAGGGRGHAAGGSSLSRGHPRFRPGLAASGIGACDVGIVLAAILPSALRETNPGAAVADFCGDPGGVDLDHWPVQCGPILEDLFLDAAARRDSTVDSRDEAGRGGAGRDCGHVPLFCALAHAAAMEHRSLPRCG